MLIRLCAFQKADLPAWEAPGSWAPCPSEGMVSWLVAVGPLRGGFPPPSPSLPASDPGAPGGLAPSPGPWRPSRPRVQEALSCAHAAFRNAPGS